MLRSSPVLAFALSLVIMLTACQSVTGETPDPEPVLLEALELDAYSPVGMATVTGPILEIGEPFRITIQGTYSQLDLSTTTVELCKGAYEAAPMFPSPARTNGAVWLDARYVFAILVSNPACESEADEPLAYDGVQVSLDGGMTFAALVPEGADGIDPDHRYTYDVTGAGEAVRFRIADQIASDNYGVLKIEVYGFE